MNLYNSQIIRQIHPPSQPAFTIGDWTSVEASIGTSLPGDYKELISIYGSGWFGGSIGFANPFESPECYQEMLNIYRNVEMQWPGRITDQYQLYSNRRGLLPWGGTGSGHMFNWLVTSDRTADWPMVFSDEYYGKFVLCENYSTSRFLFDVATENLPGEVASLLELSDSTLGDFASSETHLATSPPTYTQSSILRFPDQKTWSISEILRVTLPKDWICTTGVVGSGLLCTAKSRIDWQPKLISEDVADLRIMSDTFNGKSPHDSRNHFVNQLDAPMFRGQPSLLGELTSREHIIPWVEYSLYDLYRQISFFWIHQNYECRLDATVSNKTYQRWVSTIFQIAESIEWM